MCLSILGLHDLITLHSMAFLLYKLKCFLEIFPSLRKTYLMFFQLEEKLKEKVDPELAEKIDLNGEQDVFHR